MRAETGRGVTELSYLGSLEDTAMFVIIAQAGSLSAASRASGIPVARLSRRLAALEAIIGIKLIERSSRYFALTDQGRDYLAAMAEPMQQIQDEFGRTRHRTTVPHGTLRLSASPDFGAPFLSPVIAAFALKHPRISFDIDLCPRQVDLRAERFDAAIRVGPLVDSDLTSRLFATVPTLLYASTAYLAQHGRPSHPAQLTDHTCLPLPHMHEVARFRRGKERAEGIMRGPAKVNNLVMLRRLCGDGVGIAALNSKVASEGNEHCPIEQVLSDWELEPTTFYFLTSSRLLPARTRAFFEFARERLAEQGY